MANLTPRKKTSPLTHIDEEDVSDAESVGNTSTFSDSHIIRQSRRKSGKSSKGYPTKLKHIQSSTETRHSTSSHKKYSDTAKERMRMKNTTKYIITNRKIASRKTKDDIIEESKKVNSSCGKIRLDYLKEFDLIRDGSMSREIPKFSENESVFFSLIPITSPSEPFTLLPKRKYSRGTISIKIPDDVSGGNETKCEEEDLNGPPLKLEFENTDVGVSSEKSEVMNCPGDSKYCNDTQLDNGDAIFVKKPVKIKYTEEASNKTKDLIVYTEDFLKELTQKKGNNSTPKKELYESILKESADYRGKSLRIITDVEKYCCTLNNKSKPRSRCKISKTSVKSDKKAFAEQSVPLKEDISKETVDTKSLYSSYTRASEDPQLVKIKRSKSMQILQRETEKFVSLNRGKSRIALKKINIENIIASSFSYYFHFFAKFERPLKSGATISKKSSTKWLRKSGIVCDNADRSMAEKCFKAVANAKCVLNIYDYVKCLKKIARNRNMLLVDMLCLMMSIDLHPLAESFAKKLEKQRNESTEKHSVPEVEQKTESKKDASCLEII